MGRLSKEKESWGAGQEGTWSGSLTYVRMLKKIPPFLHSVMYVLCVCCWYRVHTHRGADDETVRPAFLGSPSCTPHRLQTVWRCRGRYESHWSHCPARGGGEREGQGAAMPMYISSPADVPPMHLPPHLPSLFTHLQYHPTCLNYSTTCYN